jgi:hypothetical protein
LADGRGPMLASHLTGVDVNTCLKANVSEPLAIYRYLGTGIRTAVTNPIPG